MRVVPGKSRNRSGGPKGHGGTNVPSESGALLVKADEPPRKAAGLAGTDVK